jgi:osmoprotectant transport system permease protein
MAERRWKPDKVALTGCIVGVLSMAPGWLTLRPNRLASGTSLKIWDSAGWEFTAVIIALWLICLALNLAGNTRRKWLFLGLALNVLVILTFAFSGISATRLLGNASSLSRVSLGVGFWGTLLGAYIAIFPCRERLRDSLWRQSLVSWTGLAGIVVLFAAGLLNNLSLVVEFRQQEAQFFRQLANHVLLFGGSVIIGTLIGIPLGIWAGRSRVAEKPIFFITNIMQTVPSLALFGLLIAPLSALSFAFPILHRWGISGIGTAPAVIALVLYSLLPVARNTYTGLKQLDPAVMNAGFGMGMSRAQVFRSIEVPLSAPLVLEGVHTASVQAVGNTAVAALIGAGGLGYFIFQGISQAADDVVIIGAVPIMMLALSVDIVMRQVVKTATPKGMVTR